MRDTIDLYKAIAEMRAISRAGGTFSFKFRKWDRQRRDGGELCFVESARLRKKATDDQIENSQHKLFFTNTVTGEARVCWQILIMEFNGMRTVL